MEDRLFLDIETYSPVDIKDHGVYRYAADANFDILILSYAYGDEPVQTVDVVKNGIPERLRHDILDDDIIKVAHNATFERVCFSEYFGKVYLNPAAWECTRVRAMYNGWPESLKHVGAAMKLADEKLTIGSTLIKTFCIPCKPSKANGMRVRNLPKHLPDKWEQFKAYAKRDVEVCREIWRRTDPLPEQEAEMYALSERINDAGLLIDTQMAWKAITVGEANAEQVRESAKKGGVDRVNNLVWLKAMLLRDCGIEAPTLSAEVVETLLAGELTPRVRAALEARQQLSRTSTTKYAKMLDYASLRDNRARGVHHFYGASRTGRYSSRGLQIHNMPQTHIDTDAARNMLMVNPDAIGLCYESVSDTLSQLVRTVIIAPEGEMLYMCDFSSVEARALAWMANETWVLECLAGDGKLYEEVGSRMFGVPKRSIVKGSLIRQQSKIATLACGYGGSVAAFEALGGDKLGLNQAKVREIVTAYRAANPNIVLFWRNIEIAARSCVATGSETRLKIGTPEDNTYITFRMSADRSALNMVLPSGRALYYRDAHLAPNRFGEPSVHYREQLNNAWVWTDTYGGKLTENATQAICRDLLCAGLMNADAAGLKVVMHVHDEIVVEAKDPADAEKLRACMVDAPAWARGLPLDAEVVAAKHYKK